MIIPPTPFKVWWIVWLVSFAVAEYIAVKNGHGTFTEFVRWIIGTGIDDREWFRWVARGIVLGVLLWLVPHFMTKFWWFK